MILPTKNFFSSRGSSPAEHASTSRVPFPTEHESAPRVPFPTEHESALRVPFPTEHDKSLRRGLRKRGFTLIELVVAVAIAALVAAIAVPTYRDHIDKTCANSAMQDILEIDVRIQRFYSNNFSYPDSLTQVQANAMVDCWEQPYNYLRLEGAVGNGTARRDGSDNPINSDYDLYSAGKDKKTHKVVNNKNSQDDIIRARNGSYVGLASDF